MQSLRLKNVRSLGDSHTISIQPITLLLGTNSSGKSTFARIFPLLRQSSEASTREAILWLGRFVDFGSFRETLSRFSLNGSITFEASFRVAASALNPFSAGSRRATELTSLTLSISCKGDVNADEATSFCYEIVSNEFSIYFEINSEKIVTALRVNGFEHSQLVQNKLKALNWVNLMPRLYWDAEADDPTLNDVKKQIFQKVRIQSHGNTTDDRIGSFVDQLIFGDQNLLLSALKNQHSGGFGGDAKWTEYVRTWTRDTPQYKQIQSLIITFQLSWLLPSIGSAIAASLSQIRYITPLRASAQRYYRTQGLSVNEIDAQGENVAMFLHNLSYADRADFSAWMNQYFGFQVKTRPTGGHVSLELVDPESAALGFNLADTGFGFSQMLPILIQLWSASRNTSMNKATKGMGTPFVVSIEQPELHLHPRLQAKLADVFIGTVQKAKSRGIDLRLVVETHSEQIINRIGRRIAQKKFSPTDVTIVLFEKKDMHSPSSTRQVEFDSDGYLTDWPYGFFDAEDDAQ